jgi:group I intron endonuclease
MVRSNERMVVYKLTNTINGKVYVGLTTQKLKHRIYTHSHRKGSPINNAITKYGLDAFKIEIIDKADTIKELNEKEVKWIAAFSCISPNGYNLSAGGGGTIGVRRTEEEKENLRRLWLGNKHALGHRDTKETRAQKSASRIGLKHSEKTKAKIGKAHKGRVFSEKTRAQMSESAKKKKVNRTAIDAMQQVTSKKVINLDTNETFFSAAEAARKYSVGRSYIAACCRGLHEKGVGFHWAYI